MANWRHIMRHWQLEGSFREDAARNRKGRRPANIADVRPTLRVSEPDQGIADCQAERAGWDDEFMLKLLSKMR